MCAWDGTPAPVPVSTLDYRVDTLGSLTGWPVYLWLLLTVLKRVYLPKLSVRHGESAQRGKFSFQTLTAERGMWRSCARISDKSPTPTPLRTLTLFGLSHVSSFVHTNLTRLQRTQANTFVCARAPTSDWPVSLRAHHSKSETGRMRAIKGASPYDWYIEASFKTVS